MSFEEAFNFNNLYQAYLKCRRSKQHKSDVIKFEIHLGVYLTRLSKSILNNDYKVGKYRSFMIYDPKERLIECLPYKDRIVLMSLCNNIIEPLCERKLIYDNVACRKGKGTLFGMNRLKMFLQKYYKQNGLEGYALKCDIRKYFQSIDHVILIEKLKKMGFSNKELQLMIDIIKSKNERVGLPIGNQTSQWFGLIYLDDIDRLIKEKLGIKYYIRYMDDMILVHHDKDYLKKCKKEIEKMAYEKLHLNLNAKTQIMQLKDGIDFLGFRHILIANGNVLRLLRSQAKKNIRKNLKIIKKIKENNDSEEILDSVRQSINAYKAHIMYSNAKSFLYKQLKSKELLNLKFHKKAKESDDKEEMIAKNEEMWYNRHYLLKEGNQNE